MFHAEMIKLHHINDAFLFETKVKRMNSIRYILTDFFSLHLQPLKMFCANESWKTNKKTIFFSLQIKTTANEIMFHAVRFKNT